MLPAFDNNSISQLLLQGSLNQSQKRKVLEVTGRPGVDALQLNPDESVLALDNTAPIVWLIKTDGAGYKTATAYDIKEHEQEKPVDHFKELEERISKLEDIVNAKSNTSKSKQ